MLTSGGAESPHRLVCTIGFDLDMTLVDSRPMSVAALQHMGVAPPVVDTLLSTYGLPLRQWLPPHIDADLFRQTQWRFVDRVIPMRGAAEALRDLRGRGDRIVVVTATPSALAGAVLAAARLAVDVVVGGAWGTEKSVPIREQACCAFVGDHSDDARAAVQAGVGAIGVATGMARPLGAHAVLPTLQDLPAHLRRHRSDHERWAGR